MGRASGTAFKAFTLGDSVLEAHHGRLPLSGAEALAWLRVHPTSGSV